MYYPLMHVDGIYHRCACLFFHIVVFPTGEQCSPRGSATLRPVSGSLAEISRIKVNDPFHRFRKEDLFTLFVEHTEYSFRVRCFSDIDHLVKGYYFDRFLSSVEFQMQSEGLRNRGSQSKLVDRGDLRELRLFVGWLIELYRGNTRFVCFRFEGTRTGKEHLSCALRRSSLEVA